MDNLNYYSAWLPAGQQTDRYSSKPGCLRSKNLDIFSSSKSVKATAWSEPDTEAADIVAKDSKWHLVLKSDWKVYEDGTLFIDPSVNFPAYDISYTNSLWPYAPATRWTVQDMSVKYEWDDWRSFAVLTDRAWYVYSKTKFILNKSFDYSSSVWEYREWPYAEGWFATWYKFVKKNTASSAYIDIDIENPPLANVPIRIYARELDSDASNIALTEVMIIPTRNYYYDAQLDGITPNRLTRQETITFSWDITQDAGVMLNIPVSPRDSWVFSVRLQFEWTPKQSSYAWTNGELYIDMNWWDTKRYLMQMADGTTSDWDYNAYYSYLPIRDRKLVDIWAYGYSSSYWMKWISFQPLYKRTSDWQEMGLWNNQIVYDFITDMWWESDTAMDIVWMVVWNEQIYMVWNLDWDWYIIPCDLTWWRGTPFIAYGCAFKGVTNIDYLLYLVWEDRWISTLWVFNNQELVPVIWWKHEVQYNDIVWVEEQYKFDWKILNWRKNLILTTIDNRIFQYGQTYGGKGGTFIHELPENATITWLRTSWDNLEVAYSITEGQTTTNYVITYQDDTPMKNYNIEWEATYPIVIGNHLLEKEESDLYVSYILPSEDTSLEFWGMANHYHFWTFKTNWQTIPEAWTKWYIDWSDWMYMLDFVEANGGYLTFKLEWDLPLMTWDETMRIRDYLAPVWQPHTYIAYSEFKHFRKIWEITTENYQEWEFRFHNLNNKLELPKSYSLQIMVKGKWNNDYTPELFALDLVANQRDRW